MTEAPLAGRPDRGSPQVRWWAQHFLGLRIALAVVVWIGAYGQLGRFAGWLTYDVFDLGRHTHLG